MGVKPEGLGGGVKSLTRPGTFHKFVGFVASQLDRFFAFQLGGDPIADFFKDGLVRRKDGFERKNDVAAVRSNGKAQFSRTQAEDGVLYFGGIAELEQGIGRADGPRFPGDELVLIREIVQ